MGLILLGTSRAWLLKRDCISNLLDYGAKTTLLASKIHSMAFQQTKPICLEFAAENGSRVHTNSWGNTCSNLPTPCYSEYTLGSLQADIAARDYTNMTILFSAGNSGADANSNGEVDFDSLGNPATAKNVFTVSERVKMTAHR
jgi:hypothetical protein